jgi:hypothetical protein
VLLESLLHITPALRPACERVQAAVRNGQVRGRAACHDVSSLLSRSQLDPLPRPSRAATPQNTHLIARPVQPGGAAYIGDAPARGGGVGYIGDAPAHDGMAAQVRGRSQDTRRPLAPASHVSEVREPDEMVPAGARGRGKPEPEAGADGSMSLGKVDEWARPNNEVVRASSPVPLPPRRRWGRSAVRGTKAAVLVLKVRVVLGDGGQEGKRLTGHRLRRCAMRASRCSAPPHSSRLRSSTTCARACGQRHYAAQCMSAS